MIEENKQTNTTNILFHDEAKTTLLAGASVVADAVGCTMGPKGKCVLIQQRDKTPILTKDGVTVCRAIRLKDPMKRMGGDLLRDAAIRTNDVAGDGTTTSTVISYALMKESHRLLSTGCEALELVKGLELAKQYALHELSVQAQQITTRSQVENVATISANNDKEIGTLIADAMERVGRDGIVTVEDAKGTQTTLEVVEGLQFDRGYMSPYFVTNNDKMISAYENCAVLLTDKKISTLNEILPALEYVHKSGQPLLIIADDYENEALQALVLNRTKSNLKVVAVRAPGIGPTKGHMLEDIATLVNGKLISAKKGTELKNAPEHLGLVRKLIVSAKATTLIGTSKSCEALDARIADLRAQLSDPTLDIEDVQTLKLRLARLTGGVAIIKVGGSTELEMSERRYRIEDALNATRAAIEEGIVPGGGTALLLIANKLLQECGTLDGVKVFAKGCEEPLRRICQNAEKSFDVVVDKLLRERETTLHIGYDAKQDVYIDLFQAGIIDPVKVTRCAIENAVSIAVAFSCLDAAIYDEEQ